MTGINVLLIAAATTFLVSTLTGRGGLPAQAQVAVPTTTRHTTTIPKPVTTRKTAPPKTVPRTTSLPPTTPPTTVAPVIHRAPVITAPFVTTPTTAATTTTSTTIAALGGQLPVTPSTLPLRTKATNAHVNPVFAMLSGIGFFIALVIVVGRFWMTRPRARPS
jgi:hypothetical protein